MDDLEALFGGALVAVLGAHGELEREGGAAARALADHAQAAAKLAGGQGPGMVVDLPELERPLELVWLLDQDGELFARYRVPRG